MYIGVNTLTIIMPDPKIFFVGNLVAGVEAVFIWIMPGRAC